LTRYAGNYADYRRTLALRQARPERAEHPERSRSDPPRAAARASTKKLSFAEERELATLPDRIDDVERRVAAHSAKLADPATYAAEGAEVPSITAALTAAKASSNN
jgi:ATP-binding cassette subfamily F protein uup